MASHGIPSTKEFFLNVPLYQVFAFDEDEHGEAARDIKYFQGTMDSFCPWCGRDSVFENNSKNIEYDKWESTRSQVYGVILKCSRNKDHELFYIVKVHDNTIQKIGQFPSIADLQLQDLKKYSKVLGSERYREFTKAVGLSAHGVGVGSFVYLRRIFESLVEEAHIKAVEVEGFDEDAYQKGRFADRIAILRGHIPDFLADHPKLYSILSKGIHELSEDECLKHFPVVKVGIELILDDKLEMLRRRQKLEEASKAIHQAGVEIGK
tara:strand:- start:229 stop:1023 length:795 start_codon:yes stop_codon:yes gene_type:complete